MLSTQHVTDPTQSATVSASAGTGKTWLLITRIVRLLLNDLEPGSILAVTFTRKAAAEMRSRLNQRLLELAQCSDDRLRQLLEQLHAPINSITIELARHLYEQVLYANQAIQITTFHAFCQDVLRRFPFESNIDPGFELSESIAELQAAAWDALANEATQKPDGDIAIQLGTLFDYCNGLNNTQQAVNSFLQHRIDWLAFTQHHEQPVDFARDQLARQLGITQDTASTNAQFFSDEMNTMLRRYAYRLQQHPIKSNLALFDSISVALTLVAKADYQTALQHLTSVFLTKEFNPRSRNSSKTQIKAMGEPGESEFLKLHDEICRYLLRHRQTHLKQQLLESNNAWYAVGARLLEHFDLIKAEQRVLDFADLEWKTYQLLCESDNAHWIQYKLEQKIQHVLVDEFQDTNPTQWHLLSPLLSELGADASQHASIFIVGDAKQSIYRFRRAQPALLDHARQWLNIYRGAVTAELKTSWRSSPAIMEFVNIVFGGESSFPHHDTHHTQWWGAVEVMPLIQPQEDNQSTPVMFRNPLLEPRVINADNRHRLEANLIAEKIKQVVDNVNLPEANNQCRRAQYGDITILLRHRTHAADIEQALLANGIPFNGMSRTSLLESLEIRDMVALLECLVTPFQNLSVATVLKSPIFDFSDADLNALAAINQGKWMDRLLHYADKHPRNEKITKAATLLSDWQKAAGKLPVHDLLDKIYHEANIPNRYIACYPQHLIQSANDNLTRFIELALEIDSGRYPSINRFLFRLQKLRESDQTNVETPSTHDPGSVKLLTIHAAKGLESPIVFLADTTNTYTAPDAFDAMVHWPAEAQQPAAFFLVPRKTDIDEITQGFLARQNQEQARENDNLLYVALTRAKHYLYISGCAPRRTGHTQQKLGWYGQITDNLSRLNHPNLIAKNNTWQLSIGQPLSYATQPQKPQYSNVGKFILDPGLKNTIPMDNAIFEINPSQAPGRIRLTSLAQHYSEPIDIDHRLRGQLIHRALQLLNHQVAEASLTALLAQEFALHEQDKLLLECIAECMNLLHQSSLRDLFDASSYLRAYNEMPLYFREGSTNVSAVIDRLVIYKEKILIIDYKSHQNTDADYQQLLLEYYLPQLTYYKSGTQRLWPNHRIETALLFTANCRLLPAPC